jgi:hypothetical protein
MANAIPLLEGTDASGGYLVPDNFNGTVFQRGLNRRSAVLGMPGLRIRRANGKREKFTEYVGRPAVATVAEGAAKPATGAEYASVTLDIVKAACIVMYTQELIEDAQEDPTVLINDDVRGRVRRLHRLQRARPHVVRHDRRLVQLGAVGDDVRPSSSARPVTRSPWRCRPRWARSRATATTRPAPILAWDARQHLRDARNAGGDGPRSTADGFNQPADGPVRAAARHTRTSRRSRAPRRPAGSSASSATSRRRSSRSARTSRPAHSTRRRSTSAGRCTTCGSRTRSACAGRAGSASSRTTSTGRSSRSSTRPRRRA